MEFRYTPRDPHGSKKLFTGRTKIISKILKNILEGRSVAIFGERQIGKTLLLWMIRDIINSNINAQGLIDITLKSNIPKWDSDFENARAILIDLQLCGENEETLVNCFCNQMEEMNIRFPLKQDITHSNSLDALLKNLSKSLPDKVKLIILMDEMEEFEGLKNNQNLAGILRNANFSYNNLKFIHTGSYDWEEKIRRLGRGSPWNHLQKIYLGGINENDAQNFLIRPLADKYNYKHPNNQLTNKIIEWSGCKPLLIQEICYNLYGRKELPLVNEIEGELLEKDEINDYIKDNIFEEYQLDEDSQCILKLLCHYPLSNVSLISRKLNLKKDFVKHTIKNFDQNHFDTVHQEKKGICINGKLIELYGKDNYYEKYWNLTNGINGPTKNPIKKILQWSFIAALLLIPILLYIYTHPTKRTEEFSFPKIKILVEVPTSLEEEEKGYLYLSVQNLTNKEINSLEMKLESREISYEYGKKENNIVPLTRLVPNESRSLKVKYRVRSLDCTTLNSKLYIAGITEQKQFIVKKRPIPVKKYYGDLVSYIMGFIGLILAIFNLKKQFDVKKTGTEKK